MIGKFIKGDQVAVLYSPGFGAGWSTWNSDVAEALMFDADIVKEVLNRSDFELIEKICDIKYPDAYLGGAKDLTVCWVPRGSLVRVHEYDGSESVEVFTDKSYFMA
jgi:hypothetical protein